MPAHKAKSRRKTAASDLVPDSGANPAKLRVRELRAIVGNVPVADLLLRASSVAQRRSLLEDKYVAVVGEMTRREWGQLISDCRDRHRGTIGMWQALYGGT